MTTARRVCSVLLMLWFALYASVPELLSPCPTHDVRGTARVALTDGGHHTSAHGAPSDHAAHGQSRTPDRQHASHSCCCPGPSCGMNAMLLLPPSLTPLSTVAARHEAVTVAALDHHPLAVEHALPFATAPPLAALRAPRPSLS